MRALPLLLLAVALGAGEAEAKPPRQAHAEMLKAGDLWSALCLEAWAKEHKQRIDAVLGASEFWGDAAFATPDHILQVLDRGDEVLALTWRRVHRFLPDGRPAGPSLPLPFPSWYADLSADGRWVGVGDVRKGKHRATGLRVAVRPLAGPGEAWQLERDAGEPDPGSVVVAEDGSAVAMTASWGDAGKRRAWVASRDVDRTLPLRSIEAVGPKGRWVVGYTNEDHLTLWRGEEDRFRLRAFAPGPGPAAALDNHRKPVLINAAGDLLPLDPGMGLGDGVEIATVGRWLVLYSGSGAKAAEATDVLGNRLEGGGEQPPTLAFWRWADLAADPRAAPVKRSEGRLSVARGEPAAIFQWGGDRLALIDCAGAELAERPLAKAPAEVKWVSEMQGATMCDLADGSVWFCDRDGRELGRIPAAIDRVARLDNRLLLLYATRERTGPATLVNLAADVSRRREVKPAVAGAAYLPSHGGGLLAVAGDGSWSLLDAASGALLGQAKGEIPELFESRYGEPGRFVNRRFRLAVRNQDAPLPTDAWMPIDGWRSGRSMVVLGRDGRVVHVTAKRELKEIGVVPGAQQLAMAQVSLAVTGAEGVVLALLRGSPTGPVLVREGVEGLRSEPLAAGPWRVEEERFTPPRSSQMQWDAEKTGMAPTRLRSPEGSGLMMFCGSAVIELDPAAVKLVGRAP